MKSFVGYITSVFLALSVLCGCNKEQVEQVQLEIDRTNMKMTVGQSQKLNAELKGAEGEFVWKSSDEDLISVDAEGLVTAVAAGTAKIIVSAAGLTNECQVVVVDFTASKLELNEDFDKASETEYSHLILKGSDLQLVPKFYNADGEKVNEMAYPKYKITSSEASRPGEDVIFVDDNGLVTALNPGVATVKVTGAGKEASVTLTVKSLELSANEMTMFVNQSNPLVATVLPASLPDNEKIVEWTSYSTEYVKVNNKGVVTAVRATEADQPVQITAECGDLIAECKITVTEYKIDAVVLKELDGLKVSDDSYQMLVGDKPYNLGVAFEKDGEDVSEMVKTLGVTVGYASSNPDVAIVEAGIVSVKAAGTTRITVDCAGKKAEFTLSVIQCVESVEIVSPENPYIVGANAPAFTIEYKVYPENASVKTVTFSSTAPEVASVDSKTGVVTVHKSGDVEITLTTDGLKRPYVNAVGATVSEPATANLILSVSDAATKPTSLKIVGEGGQDAKMSIVKGQKAQLSAEVQPSSYAGTYVWSTTTPSVLSVDSKGVMTALACGTGKVVLVANGTAAELEVNVLGINPTEIKIDQEFKEGIMVSEKQVLLTASMVSPENGDFGGVNWYSSDESVATVNADGQVTILKEGSVIITAKAKDSQGANELDDVSDSIDLVFKAPEITGVMIVLPASMIEVGESMQLSYKVIPSEAEPQTVTWAMESNGDLATVTGSGVLTGVFPKSSADAVTGRKSWEKAVVKVTVDGVSATAEVAVIPEQPKDIALTLPENNTMRINESWDFNPVVQPSHLTGFFVESYGTKPDGAYFTPSLRNFVPEVPGLYSLTAYVGSNDNLVYQRQKSFAITVNPYWVQSISVPASYEIDEGGSAILVPEFTSDVTGMQPYDKTVKWTSSDESIVKVDANGKITAVAPGTANVTVVTNGAWSVPGNQQHKTASCLVTVKAVAKVVNIGDYYYSDGTTSSEIVAGKTIVGIVISRDNARSTDVKLPENCTHGLVLALGQGEGNWSSSYDAGKVNTWALDHGYQNTTGVYYSGGYVTNEFGKRLLGYNNTSALRGYLAQYGYTSGIIAALDAYAKTVTLPESVSDLYIPSIAEMQMVHSNFDLINEALKAADGVPFVMDPRDNQKDMYWTTSENEASSGNAAAVNPFTGELHGGVLKGSGIKKVRFIFAF